MKTWQKIIWRILYGITLIGTLYGVLMIFGGIGNIDCAIEMHQELSRAEEIRSYLLSLLGFPVAYVFGKLSNLITERTGIGCIE